MAEARSAKPTAFCEIFEIGQYRSVDVSDHRSD